MYFGGPCLELGYLLYKQLFGHVTTMVDVETFLATATHLERVCSGCRNRQEAEALFFKVFTEGKDGLDQKSKFEISLTGTHLQVPTPLKPVHITL